MKGYGNKKSALFLSLFSYPFVLSLYIFIALLIWGMVVKNNLLKYIEM